jgi:ABC-type glycerol-3-phosphate transport system substrate-binding protein
VRIRVLAMASCLLLSACAEQPAIYGAHSYYCCAETAAANATKWWYAGQTVTLHWLATPPSRTSDPNPRHMVLSVSLTGPFANVDALKQAISQGSKPDGVMTISAAPVFANDRMLDPASELYLPANLPPGFYNVASQTAEDGHSEGSSGIIKVIPPDQP